MCKWIVHEGISVGKYKIGEFKQAKGSHHLCTCSHLGSRAQLGAIGIIWKNIYCLLLKICLLTVLLFM